MTEWLGKSEEQNLKEVQNVAAAIDGSVILKLEPFLESLERNQVLPIVPKVTNFGCQLLRLAHFIFLLL
jgi:hypothetical protein